METANSQFEKTRDDLERNHLPGGSKKRVDIVQQIKDMYMRKKAPAKEQKGLVPTKAALFGLDVRFRAVDQAILEEKLRRNAFKRRQTRDQSAPSRHSIPMKTQYLKSQAQRDPTMAQLQTYSKAIEREGDNGLKVMHFERMPEPRGSSNQKRLSSSRIGGSEHETGLQQHKLNQLKRVQRN